MTREELMEDIQIGQIIKIYTVAGDIYLGKVDSFGPSGLKIIQVSNDVPKRIMYERISEYDIDVEESDSVAEFVSASKPSFKIDRAEIFNAASAPVSFDLLIENFENKIEKDDRNNYARICDILAYAKKIGEYQLHSDRVIKAIAELRMLSEQNSVFKLYLAAILYDFNDFDSSADSCYECKNYEMAFYLYEKANNTDMMLKSALLSVPDTKDEYIVKWLCEYAVKINNVQIIKRIVSMNTTCANRALVYWFCQSPHFSDIENLEQAYLDVNINKMKKLMEEYKDTGIEILSVISEGKEAKKEASAEKEKKGSITFYNKDKGYGYIKEDGGGSIYFYIKQVKDYDLQKKLSAGNNSRIRVTYIYGINYAGSVAADCIEMIDLPKEETQDTPPIYSGFIFEYDKFSEYGKISSEGNFYNFQFNAIKDPFLLAAIESSYGQLELNAKFNLKTRMNKNKKQKETVACDIVGVKNYSDEEIAEWVRCGVLSQREVDAWLGKETTQEERPWRISEYEPLKPLGTKTEKPVKSAHIKPQISPADDREEQICNELAKGIENPFVSMPKISGGHGYREKARTYSIGTKTDDNERILLEKAEELFIRAIQADEQLISTIPDLVNVYIRLGGYENSYIIKGLQLLSVYGYLLTSDSLMHLRIQLIDKGNYKESLEKILENSIKKCTKKNTKYHYMSKLAGLYLETGKYPLARDLFNKCSEFLEKNKTLFPNYEKMKHWPVRSIIIADYYAGDKEDAIRQAKEFLITHPEDATIKSIADGSIDETKKEEILDDIIDTIPYDNYESMDESFLVSELFSEYSSYVLDGCAYSQIRDRKYDEETGRYIWIPENEDKANNVYDSLARSSSIFGNDRKLRPGTYEEVADKRLNMAKIAEYCLTNLTELNLTSSRITLWKGRFIWATAHYMWLNYNIYSMKQNYFEDTASYFLLECISMFFKDTNYKLRYEFYDAVNRFCIIQSHLPATEFEQVEIKRAETLNKKSSGQKTVDAEIARLEGIVRATFVKILDHDPKCAIRILGIILENCNKEAAMYFATILSAFSGQIKEKLSEDISNPDDLSFEEILEDYAQKLHSNYEVFSTDLKGITSSIEKLNLVDLNLIVGRTETRLENDNLLPISALDVERCRKLINQVKTFISLKNAVGVNYEISQERANSIKNEAAYLKQEYTESPTRLSHDILSTLMQIMYDEMIKISDDITLQSLPEITVENEYEEEGYFPQNEKINLMLLISNGKSGKQCTTASNIQLDIVDDDALKKYIYVEQTHFNLSDSLPGGEHSSHQVTLHLTPDGKIPDTIFAMNAKVSYQTIKGTEECVDVVLNIHIKSEDAFVEIRNPYDISPIKPGKETETLFKGRTTDIANISNKLLAGGQGKTVLIYGQYRSGKTSLSNFIVREIQSRDKTVIIVDGLTVTEGQNAWDIVNKLTTSVCDTLDDLGKLSESLERYLDPLANQDNYEIIFTNFAKELSKVVDEQGVHILVVMDEFGRFFKNNLSDNFMQLWKSIMEIGAFNAILIGHDVVTQMMRVDTNSFGIINTYQINYIDFDATQQLVTEPTRMNDQRTRFTDNAIQYIWEQSAGNVFYVQLICQATIRFMNKRHINIVNEVYVKQAIEEWLATDADEAAYLNYGHPLFLSGEIGEDAATQDETIIVLDAITRCSNHASEPEIIRLSHELYGQSENVTKSILSSLRARRVVDQDKDSGIFSIRCRFYSDFLNDHIIQSIQ